MAVNRRGPPSVGVACRGEGGGKNRDFRPISRFILEMIQDRVIVPMERQQELVCDLSNGDE